MRNDDRRNILVIGGTGEVGARVAALLRARWHDEVVVAARTQPSDALPFRRVDLADPASLNHALVDVGTVVACVRQPRAELLEAAVARGIAYTSVAPPQLPWERLQELDRTAKSTGARIIVGAGIEPGIASVLVSVAADELGGVDEIDTALLLGVGDEYGADSMSFILDELAQRYAIQVGGRVETARAFDHAARVDFPGVGRRRAYRMPFTDQLYYPHTVGARTAVARIALDPPWLADAIAALMRVGLNTRDGRGKERLHSLTQRLQRRYAALDRFCLVVDVSRGDRRVRASLSGRRQAAATAAGAAAVVEALHAGEVGDVGVFLAEQVIESAAFLRRIAAWGFTPTIGEPRVDGDTRHPRARAVA